MESRARLYGSHNVAISSWQRKMSRLPREGRGRGQSPTDGENTSSQREGTEKRDRGRGKKVKKEGKQGREEGRKEADSAMQTHARALPARHPNRVRRVDP